MNPNFYPVASSLEIEEPEDCEDQHQQDRSN